MEAETGRSSLSNFIIFYVKENLMSIFVSLCPRNIVLKHGTLRSSDNKVNKAAQVNSLKKFQSSFFFKIPRLLR